MATNGQLTGAGLGRLLVSGLKAGKTGAATGYAKSTASAPRQAEDGGHLTSETQSAVAAEAGNGAQSSTETLSMLSPIPGNPFDGQSAAEIQTSLAIEAGTGAHRPLEIQTSPSPGADPLANTADQTTFETPSVIVGGSGGTRPSPKPTVAASRRIPLAAGQTSTETHVRGVGDSGGTTVRLKPNDDPSRRIPSADQSFTVTQEEEDGGEGGGTIGNVKPTEAPSRHPFLSDDHAPPETQSRNVVGGDERAQLLSETQHQASPVIAQLIQAARLRRRWHKAEKSLILQGRALCRAWTGGDKIAANGLFDRAATGEGNDPVIMIALSPFLAAIEKFATERAAIEKELRKLAKQLPIWKDFAEDVKGLGELRLALVVGECGDIGSYRNPSCVWKRMGLAVIDGDRQRRKTDPDEALRNGYNAERRAMAYVLGTELIKAQLRAPKDDDGKRTDGESMAIGAYGQIYLDRRAYETAREIPKAHAHNRAARYMTKRLFRDLYAAWRKT